MKGTHKLAYLLLWVGGLNWGLVGFFNFNLVEALGLSAGLQALVYDLVGLATLYIIFTHKSYCKICSDGK